MTDGTDWEQRMGGIEPWIGIDLDGTLAIHPPGDGEKIGAPVFVMVERMVRLLRADFRIKIMTARVAPPIEHTELLQTYADIQQWWHKALQQFLTDSKASEEERLDLMHRANFISITHSKDLGMLALYDDRAIQVEENTGQILGVEPKELQ